MNNINIFGILIISCILVYFANIFKYKKYTFSEFLNEIIIFSFLNLIFFIFKIITFRETLLLIVIFTSLCLVKKIIRKIFYLKSKKKNICYICLDENEINKKDIINFCNNYYIKFKDITIFNKLIDNNEIQKFDILIISSNIYDKFLTDILKFESTIEIYLRLNNELVSFVKSNIFIIRDIPFVKIGILKINGFNKILKRMFDIIVSVILIIVSMPFVLVVSIFIKMDSSGPLFYVQERETINNKKFKLYKFRSMYIDAEKDGIPLVANVNDNRITRVGKIIRSLKIDEIPQFYNVLRGEMSIVGPRPERPYFINKYNTIYDYYNLRHNVKSGITGLSHIYGNYYTEAKYRYLYDLYYISNYSLLLDIKILFKTILVIFHLK